VAADSIAPAAAAITARVELIGNELQLVTRHGIVRVNSILPARAPGRAGAPLFLLTNHQRARRDSTAKIAYTYLPCATSK
jgi:hypothetical protein